MAQSMRRKVKFWLLFLSGVGVFIPFFVFSVLVQIWRGILSVYGVYFSLSYFVPFLIYCYIIHRSVYKGDEPRYPMVPPEGRTDIYFPRTDIPRPIFEDARRYPAFFKRKKRIDNQKKKVKKSSR